MLQFLTIFMLSGHEIPRLAVPSEIVLQRGQKAVIERNLTYRGSGTSWLNGDKLLKPKRIPMLNYCQYLSSRIWTLKMLATTHAC